MKIWFVTFQLENMCQIQDHKEFYVRLCLHTNPEAGYSCQILGTLQSEISPVLSRKSSTFSAESNQYPCRNKQSLTGHIFNWINSYSLLQLSPRTHNVALRMDRNRKWTFMAFLNSGLPNFRVNLSYKSDGIRPNKCDCVKACHNMKRYLCNQCNTRTCFIDFIMA